MCTSFIYRKSAVLIGMNFDNDGKDFKVSVKPAGKFLVSVSAQNTFFPSIGVNREGVFVNDMMVDPCEAGKYKAMTSVRRRKNWFWSIDHGAMTQTNYNGSPTTQNATPVYESVHAFHIFNRRFLLDTGMYWNTTDYLPAPFIVQDDWQCMDVDYEWEWDALTGVYTKYRSQTL